MGDTVAIFVFGWKASFFSTLAFQLENNGKRKISGRAWRPIIDINAKYLDEMFTDDENIHATHYIATIYHASSFEENSRTLYIEGDWQ